jgi:hypothetical protein
MAMIVSLAVARVNPQAAGLCRISKTRPDPATIGRTRCEVREQDTGEFLYFICEKVGGVWNKGWQWAVHGVW